MIISVQVLECCSFYFVVIRKHVKFVIERRLIRIRDLLYPTGLPRSYVNRSWQKKSYRSPDKREVTCGAASNTGREYGEGIAALIPI
jgi:hypothetical protein